jgi:ribosomal protein S9
MENTGIFYTGIGKRKTSVAKSFLKKVQVQLHK